MKGKVKLGQHDILVLAAIQHLEHNAYGVSIKNEIESRSNRESSTATIYLSLNRLEEKGFVLSRMGEAEPQRGGRRKCFYEITADGEEAFREFMSLLMPLVEPIVRKWGNDLEKAT